LKVLKRLAAGAGYASWPQARQDVQRVVDALAEFSAVAKKLGVSSETIRLIQQQLDQTYHQNRDLLVG